MSVSKASFRGIPFGVESADLDGGRRAAVHELPLREAPFVEDLGLKTRAFNVIGFVVGDDWQTKRDKLLEALEKPGPGELVHPFMGTMTVQVMTFSVSEGKDKLRTALFTMTFTQSQPITYPTQASDTASQIRATTDATRDAVANAAEARVSVQNSAVAASAEAVIQGSAGAIDKALSAEIIKAAKGDSTLLGVADRFTRDLDKLIVNSAVYARKPLEYAYRVQGIVSRLASISAVAGTIDAYLRLGKAIKAYLDSLKFLDTAQGRIEQANARALIAPVSVACLNGAAEVATVVTYESRQQAEAVRSGIFEVAEQIMAETDDDDLYQAAYRLKLYISEAVPPQGYRLKDVVQITTKKSIPAVVLAYQIHGDPSKDADIIARNSIQHPGLIPGGTTLEVLP